MAEHDTQHLAHAILGASGAEKWTTCTMAPAMEKFFPEEDSEYAKEGTYAHGLFELRLRCYLSANDGADVYDCEAYVNKEESADAARYYSAELDEAVSEAVDNVIETIEELERQWPGEVVVKLEQRFDFSRWVPEGFGTGDVVIIVPHKIFVMDYKHGAGIYVEGENNKQVRLYALGAYDTYNVLYDFDEIEVRILQPRKGNFTGEVIPVNDINGVLTWAEELIVPRAKIAWAAYNGDRSEARFSPGSHCNECFCKARFRCGARARFALELAEMKTAGTALELLSVEECEAIVDRTALAVKWASDVERFLLEEATKNRVQLKRYKLINGVSRRVITDETKAFELLKAAGFDDDAILKDAPLKGIGELEKVVGKQQLPQILGKLLHKPEGALKLAPLEDRAPKAKAKKPDSQDPDKAFN